MNAVAPFDDLEFSNRLGALRTRMAERDLDLALVSVPENIFYLTGLDHWGYFAPHALLVPATGELVLVTRAMEHVTVHNQVRNARFAGHEDHETAAELMARLLSEGEPVELRLGGAGELARAIAEAPGRRRRIGVEKLSPGMPWRFAETLTAAQPNAEWIDISDLVDDLRRTKSPAEQVRLRAAAAISDTAMQAAIDAIALGASEADVAAECLSAMLKAGGTYPGFGPFIRSTSRLGEEHTTWRHDLRLAAGDRVFLELSGCVERYHAPLGRLVHLSEVPQGDRAMSEIAIAAFDAAVGALRPGASARDVYSAWQGVVDEAGLPHYRRHHCGYLIGIGFPPSWTGGNKVTGLRHDSDLVLRPGMAFHLLSWLMGSGRGDYFLSNTVLLGDAGAEVLTRSPRGITLR